METAFTAAVARPEEPYQGSVADLGSCWLSFAVLILPSRFGRVSRYCSFRFGAFEFGETMNQSILVIRILIVLFCAAGAFTASYLFPDILDSTGVAVLVGILLGVFMVLIDMLLKRFSLRALSYLP